MSLVVVVCREGEVVWEAITFEAWSTLLGVGVHGLTVGMRVVALGCNQYRSDEQ